MGAVRRPHRTTKWVWAGRVGAVAVLAWLATYLYLVGLNRAAQIAGPIGLVVMLATLFAPYLLPTYQPAAAGPSASDSVALTGSASTVASYGVPPVAAQPTTALAQAVGGVTTVVPGQSSARSDNQALVDRDLQCEQLTAALTTGRSNLVLVHGQAGSGKSALVSWVLASRGVQETSRRELTPGSRLDAGALLRDIESDTTFGSVIRPGEDRLMRLRAAMDATDRTPATVVIDGAQHLVDSKTHNLASLELDEALGVIGAGRRRIKLILVFQELPVARTGIDWLTTAEKLSVGGLPRDYFLAYLAGLDSGGALGVSALAGTQPDMLLEVLDGVPRLAELFCAVLALPQNRWSAGGLARRLDRTPTDEREQMLARELVESLSSQQRRVVTALATYAIPVTGSYVAKLLGDELSEGRVAVLLADLLIKHVIGKIGDGYYIPVQRIQDALIHGRADLQLDAGEVGKASETARRALIEAQQLDDSVTMLQARTTMAMAYLGLGEISAARDEIELAAPYRREGRSLVVLALQALIAFRFDPDGRARQLFADLEREAVGRREGDEQDFAAWDFEGLAICGRLVGQAGPLDAAVAAFRRARNQVPAPPALDARLRFWLSILQAKATPGQMEPVVAAATGAGASAGRP